MKKIRSKQKKIDQRAEYWRQSNLTEISAGTIKMHWRTWKIAMAVFFFTILLGIAVIESRALFGDDIRDALKHLGLALMIVGATGFLVVSSAHCKDDPED